MKLSSLSLLAVVGVAATTATNTGGESAWRRDSSSSAAGTSGKSSNVVVRSFKLATGSDCIVGEPMTQSTVQRRDDTEEGDTDGKHDQDDDGNKPPQRRSHWRSYHHHRHHPHKHHTPGGAGNGQTSVTDQPGFSPTTSSVHYPAATAINDSFDGDDSSTGDNSNGDDTGDDYSDSDSSDGDDSADADDGDGDVDDSDNDDGNDPTPTNPVIADSEPSFVAAVDIADASSRRKRGVWSFFRRQDQSDDVGSSSYITFDQNGNGWLTGDSTVAAAFQIDTSGDLVVYPNYIGEILPGETSTQMYLTSDYNGAARVWSRDGGSLSLTNTNICVGSDSSINLYTSDNPPDACTAVVVGVQILASSDDDDDSNAPPGTTTSAFGTGYYPFTTTTANSFPMDEESPVATSTTSTSSTTSTTSTTSSTTSSTTKSTTSSTTSTTTSSTKPTLLGTVSKIAQTTLSTQISVGVSTSIKASVKVSTTSRTKKAASSTVAAPSPSVTINYDTSGMPYLDAVLQQHNFHRTNHTVANLTWSDSLTATAQKIAQTCYYAHNITVDGGGYGQNIGAGAPFEYVPALITNGMYNSEINWFPKPYGVNNVSMSNFDLWGHFSQIVWETTTEVGCYTQYCQNGMTNIPAGYNVLPYFTVCNYSPPGNYPNQYAQVPQPLPGPTINVIVSDAS